MVAPYPQADEKAIDIESERVMNALIDIIRSIRNAHAEHNVDAGKWIEAHIYSANLKAQLSPYAAAVQALAKARPVTIDEKRPAGSSSGNSLVLVLQESEVVIPMESMVDTAAEKKRLEKDIAGAEGELARLEARLNDQSFLSKAPPPVVEKERQKSLALNDKLSRLKQEILKY